MGLSALINTSKNSLSKKSAIWMIALALAAPLCMNYAHSSPINVNTASQSELESIRGLGPSKAKAIIAEREKGGAFYDSYDLHSRVRGIGERSVGKLMENGLKIEGQSGYRETKSNVRTESRSNRRSSKSQAKARIPGMENERRGNIILGKLEGNNPAGSVKDRPALSMILHAQERGDIKPGDTLIEATSGNTGIAIAMVGAMLGYKIILVMPENQSLERRQSMAAYGAELILTSSSGGMELARDYAEQLQKEGRGKLLDQFANTDNPRAHIETTGPEIWRDTHGQITHFVSAMGTTGTITGVSTYLKSMNPEIQIIGGQPEDGSQIPGIRKWAPAYLPKIYQGERVDRIEYVTQAEAEEMARRMAKEEGIFCGISAAGALVIALRVARTVENATIVFIVCDRGDRYLSTGVFPA